MSLPNPLSSRRGRWIAFFLLYVTEGIPLGFTATAVATQMRRQGMSPAVIGAFVGALYLPWSWKWAMGPVVDMVYVRSLGRRRGWILAMQVLMVAALIHSIGVDPTEQMKLYTAVILLANVFGATQDVAIDALAVGVLKPEERGTANGLMFAGAYIGNAVGGSGVLFLSGVVGFSEAGLLAIGAIMAVTIGIVWPMRETEPAAEDTSAAHAEQAHIARRIAGYATTALRAFFGSRAALLAAVFAILPCGALSLSLALATSLQVELGLTDNDIAWLSLAATILSAGGCVLGGFLSDRLGRRRMLAIYVAGICLMTALMALAMWQHDYIMPVDPKQPDRLPVAPALVRAFVIISLIYAAFQGLMYGTRTALFMDVCDKAVAATQFTAYMSILNFVIWYSATWQGWMIEQVGYPATLAIDAAFGAVGLGVLPGIRKKQNE